MWEIPYTDAPVPRDFGTASGLGTHDTENSRPCFEKVTVLSRFFQRAARAPRVALWCCCTARNSKRPPSSDEDLDPASQDEYLKQSGCLAAECRWRASCLA